MIYLGALLLLTFITIYLFRRGNAVDREWDRLHRELRKLRNIAPEVHRDDEHEDRWN